VATAFVVSVPHDADPSLRWEYLVTARHSIEMSEADSIYVRINKKEGSGFVEYETNREDWFQHDDADVAAIPSVISAPSGEGGVAYMAHGVENFVGPGPDYAYGNDRVTIGDDLFAVGLFLQHYGKERNLPIARAGNVARMPDFVDIKKDNYGNYQEVVAYLVEFVSWGGMSGSPVMWPIPEVGNMFFGPAAAQIRMHATALLGLVSAHFSIYEKAETQGDVYGEIKTKLNSGIAIVTPAEAIRQLLMREDFVQKRGEKYKLMKSEASREVQLD
jgi:hypothetical protein